ncbi:acyltransferase family protein [Vibrio sp. RC27]
MNKCSLKNHYVMMDFLRFFCALYVVSLHLIGNLLVPVHRIYQGEVEAYQFFYSNVPSFIYYGWIGVPIFFTISGFVISISADRSTSAVQFLVDRALRIFPGLWICTLISFVFLINMKPDLLWGELFGSFLKSVTLFPMGPHIDGVVWTLIVELVFYFYVFLILYFFGKKYIGILIYILLFGSLFYHVLDILVLNEIKLAGQLARRLVLEHGSFFAIGILLARYKKLAGFKCIVPLVIIGLIVSFVNISGSVEYIFKIYGDYGASESALFPFFIWVVSCFLIRSTLGNGSEYFKLVARKVGLMTYPLYLIHYLVGRGIYVKLYEYTDLTNSQRLICSIAIVIAIASLISSYLEPTFREYLKSLKMYKKITRIN